MNSQRHPVRSALAATMLILFTILLIFQQRSNIASQICAHTNNGLSKPTEAQGEKKIPPLSALSTVFAEIPTFENMSHANDNAWSKILMPPNSGFIRVKHNETYVMDWGISMFHALHCLSLLRTMLQDNLAEAASAWHSQHSSHSQAESAQFLHQAHIPHCIGYLAQVCVTSAAFVIPD